VSDLEIHIDLYEVRSFMLSMRIYIFIIELCFKYFVYNVTNKTGSVVMKSNFGMNFLKKKHCARTRKTY